MKGTKSGLISIYFISIFIFLLFLPNIHSLELKHSEIDIHSLMKDYIINPQQFLMSHSNKDNFIAIFSNFTHSNGEEIYKDFIEGRYQKDVQSMLDNLNNFKVKYVDKWEYDTLRGRFNLPDEIRNYSDFYKWQMIISIMKTMETFPIIHKGERADFKNKNLRKGLSLVFPEDINILDPPL